MNSTETAPAAGPLSRRLAARNLGPLGGPQRSELDRLLAVHVVVRPVAAKVAA